MITYTNVYHSEVYVCLRVSVKVRTSVPYERD